VLIRIYLMSGRVNNVLYLKAKNRHFVAMIQWNWFGEVGKMDKHAIILGQQIIKNIYFPPCTDGYKF